MKLRNKLRKLGACKEAIAWVGDKTLRQAWDECPCADWMLWLYQRHIPNKWLCAELAKQFSARALDAAGASNWGDLLRGLPSVVDADTAATSEFFCAFASSVDANVSDIYFSKVAAYSAAYDASDASDASDAAADVASAIYGAREQKHLANMVRKEIKVSHFAGLGVE
jgi:hypothetical protein